MNRIRDLLRIGTLAMCLELMAALVATTGAAAAEPTLVGTWMTTIEVSGEPTSSAIISFSADGRVVATTGSSSVGPALGEWARTGKRQYAITIVQLMFDDTGAMSGTLTMYERVWLAPTPARPDTFGAPGAMEVRDLAGTLLSATEYVMRATRIRANEASTTPTVITASGGAARDISRAVARYKELLGGADNAGTPGTQPSGFRTIVWDAVPEEFSAPNGYPADFFNGDAAPRARGAVFEADSGSLMVSAAPDNAVGVLPRFGNINPTYPDIFHAFSKEKLFSPVEGNVVDLTFFVPGTDTPAVVRGFGAIYLDVDTDHTAFQYFDANGISLGSYGTPISDNGFSFLGVAFPDPIIHRVRITYGTAPLGADDGPDNDVAVMDDFIYGEPRAAP